MSDLHSKLIKIKLKMAVVPAEQLILRVTVRAVDL